MISESEKFPSVLCSPLEVCCELSREEQKADCSYSEKHIIVQISGNREPIDGLLSAKLNGCIYDSLKNLSARQGIRDLLFLKC